MIQYLEILQEILDKGTKKPPARENMPSTISRFSIQKRFNLIDGFPLLTTKKMFYKGMIHELIWFLKGDTNIYYLHKNGVRKFWHKDGYGYYLRVHAKKDTHVRTFKEWCEALDDPNYAKHFGDLGLIYPHQWRRFTDPETSHKKIYDSNIIEGGVDQITNVLKGIQKNPNSRYHIVTAWNPAETSNMKCSLPPCHMLFMFNCREMGVSERFDWWIAKTGIQRHYIEEYQKTHDTDVAMKYLDSNNIPRYWLDLDLTQRSCDTPLGVPVNISSYALLLEIFAKLTKMAAGEFIWNGKDVHIYENQLDGVYEQLKRTPTELPTIDIINEWKSVDDIKYEDFVLVNYKHQPEIKFELSTGLEKGTTEK